MSTERYRVAATTRFGGRRLVYYRGSGRYSWRRGRSGQVWMSGARADAAKRWAGNHKATDARAYPGGRHPFLELAPGASWPTDSKLLARLNRIGQKLHRPIRIISGKRSLSDQQVLWDRWQRYLDGGPPANRAAYPNANAPHIRGVAADCGVIDRHGEYWSFMDYSRRARSLAAKAGISARVPGEAWHLQRNTTY